MSSQPAKPLHVQVFPIGQISPYEHLFPSTHWENITRCPGAHPQPETVRQESPSGPSFAHPERERPRAARARVLEVRVAREHRVRQATRMSSVLAKVRHGRITIDESTDLPEGTTVQLYIVDQRDELDEEEWQVLDAALEDAARSVARGETIPAEDVLRVLDDDA